VKRIVILGSTGSIGRAAVEIIRSAPDRFEVVGLAAGRNAGEMIRQLEEFPAARFTMRDGEALAAVTERAASAADRAVGYGGEAMVALITETAPDLVLNALVGISGLVPTMTALEAGYPVALANKETLVAAGELIAPFLERNGELVLPVDSEHFSLSRCLRGYGDDTREIILTASGGPFYGRDPADLAGVAVSDVLDHPTWKMGKKVTVDSAHLLNKGLEVIEAHWLFRFPLERIRVVIHPQSLVHAIIRLRDGSMLSHIAPADMRLPIAGALHHPDVYDFPWKSLGLDELGTIEFIPFESGQYPAFDLAIVAAEAGGTAPAVLNAADEAAVGAFLAGRIGFLDIIAWIEEALSAHRVKPVRALDDVLAADRWARDFLAERHSRAERG
jgi:1-deoxy-D-xylulose-5-phosphate reductoisomerase